MDLSVVIVNWNTRDMLRDCLASLFANLGSLRGEVFVVDNGSADGSQEMVGRDFPLARLIRNKENRGFAAANNQAIGLARGKYVLLLNSDTLVHGDVLVNSYAYMEAHPEVGVLGCRVLNADGTIQKTCGRFPGLWHLAVHTSGLCHLSRSRRFDSHLMLSWKRNDERDVEIVSGCYMFVRATALAEVGLLDEDFFFFGEETDWCRRFGTRGGRLRFVPVGDITHYGGGSSGGLKHRRDLMLTASLVRLHQKHFGRRSARLVWLILFVHNLSRAAYWGSRFLLDRQAKVHKRFMHFRAVVRDYGTVWPMAHTNRS